jgi:hypothetical protein
MVIGGGSSGSTLLNPSNDASDQSADHDAERPRQKYPNERALVGTRVENDWANETNEKPKHPDDKSHQSSPFENRHRPTLLPRRSVFERIGLPFRLRLLLLARHAAASDFFATGVPHSGQTLLVLP